MSGIVKATHKSIRDYYAALAGFKRQRVRHEGAVRSAFQSLLTEVGHRQGWILIPELAGTAAGRRLIPDGTFRDDYYIERGHWEAKDTDDDLPIEIKKKIAKGYPVTNIIFEDTQRAYLYQDGQRVLQVDMTSPQELADLLNAFFSYTEPAHEDFNKAIGEFKDRIPDLARGLVAVIETAHRENRKFISAFSTFYDLCRTSLNPNLSVAAVDEMLVQHLLTERLIRKIFDNPEFTRRNVIAREVENVIDALVSRAFDRDDFLKSLDRFYIAIESAAQTIRDFSEKQHFLNVIYERFFQGYSVKVADTHGIVYTPQPIVDFMAHSVVEILQKEFGKALGDQGVNILDPCTGTGNFIVNLLRRVPKRDLARMYREQVFANEVMLMPYYIATLNIEHAHFELTGEYAAFNGLCFVDTLELAEATQTSMSFMNAENALRVERQKGTPITVIIGNPPYNVGQINENDNNRNRRYETIDRRVRETYVRGTAATLSAKVYDAYVKFWRWATDRLGGRPGVVCFITNNGFLFGNSFDGFRKHLAEDYTTLYHLDIGGDARRDGGGNVFGIKVGVGITIAVSNPTVAERRVLYATIPHDWSKENKLSWLAETGSCSRISWGTLPRDGTGGWSPFASDASWASFIPLIVSEEVETAGQVTKKGIFLAQSLGVSTNRDDVVYDFDRTTLVTRVTEFSKAFNAEVDRLRREMRAVKSVDDFVDYDLLKWSSTLKRHLLRGRYVEVQPQLIRSALYRPFTKKLLYYASIFVDRPGRFSEFLRGNATEDRNLILLVPGKGNRKEFGCFISSEIVSLDFSFEKVQCLPLIAFGHRQTDQLENITDWALDLFRDRFRSKGISKRDIFHYIYGILHHPGYRSRFVENLGLELPRIPLVTTLDDFRAFQKAGKKLVNLHLDYEKAKPWPVKWVETPGVPISYRVEQMRLSKDKTSIKVNDSLTLTGVPSNALDYRLGNRSALGWVMDQYRITRDAGGEIVSDPNRTDDPEYILRLVGQVIRVSVETMKIIKDLPASYGGGSSMPAGD